MATTLITGGIPVVSVIQADDRESALAATNAVGYGLSLSIYTTTFAPRSATRRNRRPEYST
jgi:acyl-CoA reductase-like NAD-dependent aldehyde dehydrogenase